jgi:hypothetical protein
VKTQKATQSIRLVVKPQLKTKVKARANELGIDMSTYIKHLILIDIHKIPTFEASDRVKKAIKESLEDKNLS